MVDLATSVPRDPTKRRRAEKFARRYYDRIGMPERVIGPKDIMTAAGILKYYSAKVIRESMDAVCRYYGRKSRKARVRHIGLLRSYCEHHDDWVAPHLRRAMRKTSGPTPMTISDDYREQMKMRARRSEDREERSSGLGAALEAIMARTTSSARTGVAA